MSPALDIVTHGGPIAITVAYVGLYYALQINVLRVKNRLSREYAERGEKFDRYFGQDRFMLAADRSQLNMLEHMGPFLVLLWLVSLFVGPGWATGGGAVYLLARAAYPFAMGGRLGRGVRGSIALSTAPGYAVLVYFIVVLVVAFAASLG